MKLLIISDVHGFKGSLEKALEAFDRENCSHILFLGDALYHGPRNAFDETYDAASTAELLNQYSDKIIAVRGNCDSEVDQMVLKYPIMSDYHVVLHEERKIFLTHGHIYSKASMPPLKKGDIFASGHSHVATIEELDGVIHFNPGSVSLPRNNTEPSYGLYDGSSIKVISLSGEVLMERTL